MLSKLTISNYALISELNVEFHSGLNSVTGETGAGKSIILGALGLILGNRADLTVLKNKNNKCIIEGIFQIGNYNLKDFFVENDLDYDSLTILRREIIPSGKSRSFINDTPVTLKIMRELGLQLIDIHSQHQNLELGNQKFQLNLVDTVSNAGTVLSDYKKCFNEYVLLQNKLKELTAKSEKANADLDYFQFQFDQLEKAELVDGEQEELETELEKLTHAEEIKSALLQIQQLLDDERFSAIQNVKEGAKLLDNIQQYLSDVPDLAGRLQSCYLELKDIFDETGAIVEKVEHNPVRIQQINDRLNLIFSLQQKHHIAEVSELIKIKNSFQEKINEAVGFEDEIKETENQLSLALIKLEKKSTELTVIRTKSFAKIQQSVQADLMQLGMKKSRFKIAHHELPDFTQNGKDAVSFLFSANVDSSPTEISKIASGGEMSRLMLAIKNLLRSSKAMPTVVFDEIDSGVSGEIALKMGNILKSFSSSTQIVNITHLPQIAAKGDAHFKVHKFEENSKTFISIKLLNNKERVEELAKMVGGDNLTDSVIKTAEELLEN